MNNKITQEIDKLNSQFEKDAVAHVKDVKYTLLLPEKGLSNEAILKNVDDHLNLGEYKWKEGRVSGTVYYFDPALIELITNVYGKASYTNPLHPDVFPGICKMEAEVVRMTADLFNGDAATCGTV